MLSGKDEEKIEGSTKTRLSVKSENQEK